LSIINLENHPKGKINAKPHTNLQTNLLWIVIFINFLRSAGGTSISIGLPDFIIQLTGTEVAYGLVLGIFSLISTCFQTPAAFLSDKIGRKKSIIFWMIIYLIGTLLCSIAQTIPQIIIFRAIQGAGAYSSILLSVISDTYTKEERSRALSYYMISLTGGYLVGNVAGGFIVEFLGTRSVFHINALLIGIACILVIFFLPETHPKLNEKSKVISLDNVEEKETHKLRFKVKYNFLMNIEYIFGVFMNLVRSFCISGLIGYQVWVFTQDFHLSEIKTSLVLLPVTFIYISGIYLAPKLSQKFGILRLIQYSAFVFIISGSLILIKFQLWWYLGFSLSAAFTMGVLEPEIASFTQNYLPDSSRGLGNGVFNTFGYLFGALGQMLLPIVSKSYGYRGVYILLIIIWMCMALLLLIIRNKYV
jgi:MFS family permease